MTVVTPERAPLSLFGERGERGGRARSCGGPGVELRTGVVGGARAGGGLVLEPGGEHARRRSGSSRCRGIVGPGVEGVPCDDEGFILAGDDARVQGCERTWAAGDGVESPVKFGGLATHQARRAAAAIARLAGVTDAPDPGEPVLHGRLLIGRGTRRLSARGDAEGAPLWWPHGKIAGEYLPRWLTEHGVAPTASAEPPDGGGITVKRPLRDIRGAGGAVPVRPRAPVHQRTIRRSRRSGGGCARRSARADRGRLTGDATRGGMPAARGQSCREDQERREDERDHAHRQTHGSSRDVLADEHGSGATPMPTMPPDGDRAHRAALDPGAAALATRDHPLRAVAAARLPARGSGPRADRLVAGGRRSSDVIEARV